MDLFVTLKKLDADGKEVFFDSWMLPKRLSSSIWLAAAFLQRTGQSEIHSVGTLSKASHRTGEKVKPGEIVPCEIPILPSGTLFRKGEKLRLVVSGIFGGGEIKGAHYGFNASVNQGAHAIYTGGKYDSYLLVPMVKQGQS